MFFENDNISFNLLDVIELKQKNVSMYNSRRNFNALSFRIRSDAHLKTETDTFNMNDNYLSFVPSRLNYRRVAKIDELIAIHFELVNCSAKDIEFFEPQDPEPFRALFTSILKCWSEKKAGYKYKCSALFYEILALCNLENHKPTVSNSKIQKSTDYLLAHYRRPELSIKEIAEKSFVSEVYFRKLFKEHYGISPQKYIIRLRIQYAKELISSGYYSLKEIALMSGYTDYKYFTSEFKKQTGISPSAYSYNFGK
ncbi:MAG: helix-turn-helix transcriptional regulator [Clostridia bacterium]|nr:helix-turn-helix transcriptional regulator [Clostridia bacterium]